MIRLNCISIVGTFLVVFTALDAICSDFSNIRLLSCNTLEGNCLQVTAREAELSQIKPLFFFKNSNIKLYDKKNRLTEEFKGLSAYIDFTINQLVIYDAGRGQKKLEIVYNLHNFQKSIFEQ